MPFEVRAGHTFVREKHLWIIATSPSGSDSRVILVYVTSKRFNSEKIVVMKPGIHSRIYQDSVISFRDALIEPASLILKNCDLGYYKPLEEKIPGGIVKNIQDGILKSDLIPNDVRSFYSNLVQNS